MKPNIELLRIFAAILFLLLNTQVFSQEFLLGAKASGKVMTTWFPDTEIRDLYNNRITNGYSFGAFISFPLPNDFSLVSEVTYAVKGRVVELDGQFQNSSRYNFIDFPMLLRKSFRIGTKEFTSYWFFNIGPDIGYWLGGSGTLGIRDYEIVFVDTLPNNVKFETMYMQDINRFIFGLNFGIGYTAYIYNNQRFFAEARFTYGHTHLGDENTAYINILGFEDNLKTNFRVLDLSFGYAYSFDLRNAKKGKSTMDRIRKKKR